LNTNIVTVVLEILAHNALGCDEDKRTQWEWKRCREVEGVKIQMMTGLEKQPL